MREHLAAFLESVAESFSLEGPVYEFGVATAPDASTAVRLGEPFAGNRCTGWNLLADPQADRPDDVLRLPLADEAARTVVCLHILEHLPDPRQAVEEMVRILAPGGTLLICCSAEQPDAQPPRGPWRPTPGEMQALLAGLEATLIGWQGTERHAHTVYAVGCKRPVSEKFLAGMNRFADRFQHRLAQIAASEPWGRKLRRLLAAWTSGQLGRRKQRDYFKAQFILHLPVAAHLANKPELLAGCLLRDDLGGRRG